MLIAVVPVTNASQGELAHPTWSPDGTRLVWSATSPVGAQVLGRRRGAIGGEPTELMRELVEPVGPRSEKENRPLLAAGQRARAECREETGAQQRRLPAP